MSDRLIVILPPVLTAEERIAEAICYSSLTDGDGSGSGSGTGYGSSYGYGHGDGDGWGRGYGMHAGDGRSSIDV